MTYSGDNSELSYSPPPIETTEEPLGDIVSEETNVGVPSQRPAEWDAQEAAAADADAAKIEALRNGLYENNSDANTF